MKTHEDVVNEIGDWNKTLADKGVLVLTVHLSTEEEADELYKWMYAKDKPMKAELDEIAWDKAVVPLRDAELLLAIRSEG